MATPNTVMKFNDFETCDFLGEFVDMSSAHARRIVSVKSILPFRKQ